MVQYSEKVMEHFSNPRNVGEVSDADGIGEVGNPVCGDMMKFTIKVRDNVLEEVKFLTFGCGAAIAVSSMISEMARGKTLEEALKITRFASEEGIDMIVMGSRGHTGLKKLLLGSVSNAVVQEASTNVLIVK